MNSLRGAYLFVVSRKSVLLEVPPCGRSFSSTASGSPSPASRPCAGPCSRGRVATVTKHVLKNVFSVPYRYSQCSPGSLDNAEWLPLPVRLLSSDVPLKNLHLLLVRCTARSSLCCVRAMPFLCFYSIRFVLDLFFMRCCSVFVFFLECSSFFVLLFFSGDSAKVRSWRHGGSSDCVSISYLLLHSGRHGPALCAAQLLTWFCFCDLIFCGALHRGVTLETSANTCKPIPF